MSYKLARKWGCFEPEKTTVHDGDDYLVISNTENINTRIVLHGYNDIQSFIDNGILVKEEKPILTFSQAVEFYRFARGRTTTIDSDLIEFCKSHNIEVAE